MTIKYYVTKLLRITLLMILMLTLVIGGVIGFIAWYYLPQLPSTEALKDVRLQVPLKIYTQDNLLIAEFGEQKRIPVSTNQIPKTMLDAVLAAEDDRFYDHSGVDIKSLFRAVVNLMKTGEIQQGASTITMQVSRNFFLSREKTFHRKFKEILLSLKIERELSKSEILELYLNKIFFGNRAYGVGAAAQVYYGKSVQELSLAECAMLAGLPKAPSANNPLSNREAAIERRNYILKRMLSLNYITQEQYESAVNALDTSKLYHSEPQMDAPYIAEMVRGQMQEQFGEEAYTNGYKVITTVDSHLQKAAQEALRNALWAYDERHGYRGHVHEKLPKEVTNEDLDKILEKYPMPGGLIPAVVTQIQRRKITAYSSQSGELEIDWADLGWARRVIRRGKLGNLPNSASDIVRRGDVIFVRKVNEWSEEEDIRRIQEERRQTEKKNNKSANKKEEKPSTETKDIQQLTEELKPIIRWRLAEVPQAEGAFVSLNPNDGSILALAGGFDFYQSKFNRVTQAERQPGSNFKPFIYSAALEYGMSPESVVNDAPVVFRVGNRVWRPSNAGGSFLGPISLRKALALSRNLASIRVLMKVGVDRAIDYVRRFGFRQGKIPRNLTIALGTADVTPLELVTAYATFANGGYRVDPYIIRRIENADGKIVKLANPLQVCRRCSFVPPVPDTPRHEEKDNKENTEHFIPTRLQNPKAGLRRVTSDERPAAILASPDQVSPRYATQVIQSRNASTITSMLKDVIRVGTGKEALKLKRDDIAGKTGTTNDQRDAWFSGYTPDVVATAWVGFDRPRSLGNGEYGGRAALPMWIEYMSIALKGKPINNLEPINKNNKLLLANNTAGGNNDDTVTRGAKYRNSNSSGKKISSNMVERNSTVTQRNSDRNVSRRAISESATRSNVARDSDNNRSNDNSKNSRRSVAASSKSNNPSVNRSSSNNGSNVSKSSPKKNSSGDSGSKPKPFTFPIPIQLF